MKQIQSKQFFRAGWQRAKAKHDLPFIGDLVKWIRASRALEVTK